MSQVHHFEQTPSAAASLHDKLAANIPADRILLTRKEVAEYLGVSPRTMDVQATKHYHDLPFALVGNKAMYRLSDVEAFLDNRRKNA